MGAFLLLRRGGEAELERAALASLGAQGFGTPRRFEARHWTAYVYGKYSGDPASWYFRDDRNFGFCSGTFFYTGATGAKALEKFGEDDAAGRVRWEEVYGSFCLVLCRAGRLELVRDRVGVYKVYRDETLTIVSSSFLAVLATVARPVANKQAIYEYVFQGATYDGRTVIDQVRVLEPRAILRLEDPPSIVPPSAFWGDEAAVGDIAGQRALIHGELRRQFRTLVACFNNNIDTALSGGYDSRLLLALLREQRATPRVHVYGKADDLDVIVAQAIAAGERLSLHHVDKSRMPDPSLDAFPEIVAKSFWSFDGYPADGVIDNGADVMTRSERQAPGVLALNGGGGEIFRNFFYLPDRSFTVRQLLYAFFSQFDPRMCSAAFVEEEYLGNLAVAILRLLGRLERPGSALATPLARSEIELVYAYFRCGFWMGRNNSVNNRFGYFATPFIEPKLIALAAGVPLRHKNHGNLEAQLIAGADPSLAKYVSAYGESFDHPPSLKRIVKDYLTLLRPVGLRRMSYRVQNRIGRKSGSSRLLQSDYLSRVLDASFPEMRRYFDMTQIAGSSEMNRICTLEYLFEKYRPVHP